MRSQIAQRCRKWFHGENKGKNAVSFLCYKKTFFHDTTPKTSKTCKIEDLSFLNRRSHLKKLLTAFNYDRL